MNVFMNAILLSQIIKAIKLRYPNDITLTVKKDTNELFLIDRFGTTRTEKLNKTDSDYIPMLAKLYGFDNIQVITVFLETRKFLVTATKNGKSETIKIN